MEAQKYTKEDAYQTLELINNWINNVDTKASFALAFIGIMLGFCFTGDLPAAFISFQKAQNKTIDLWIEVIAVVILITFGVITSTVLLSVLIAKAKNTSGKKSVMFFGTIAEISLNDYKSKTMNMSETDLTKDLLEQVHTNSIICTQKFKRYNTGMVMMIIFFIAEILMLSCGLL